MNYLEVKFDTNKKEEVNPSSFISDVINKQKNLGLSNTSSSLNHQRLKELGFEYNESTNGYGLKKEFTLEELEFLSSQIDLLENHILIHGYIELKTFEKKLYFWDKALIYEGIDSFEYCIKYHNIFNLGKLTYITKSDAIKETLLILVNFTKRYSEPSLEFITQNCVWDKKEGYKILKEFVKDINEYIPIKEAKNY